MEEQRYAVYDKEGRLLSVSNSKPGMFPLDGTQYIPINETAARTLRDLIPRGRLSRELLEITSRRIFEKAQ